jgi:hypothetical protein
MLRRPSSGFEYLLTMTSPCSVIHGEIGIFADPDVLTANAFDRAAAKRAKGARNHRQDAEQSDDAPIERDADTIFDRLTARIHSGRRGLS